jgi:HK97 family phage prohead protease
MDKGGLSIDPRQEGEAQGTAFRTTPPPSRRRNGADEETPRTGETSIMKNGADAAPLRLETKFIALDETDTAAEGRVEGYASLFEMVDEGGDVVAPGAFAASLARRGRNVKLLWQHDPTQPIGVWETLREDARGLRVSGRLLAEVRRGAEAAALLKAGAVDGLSIGYRVIRSEKTAQGGRRLLEVDLWEVSLVTFPMLPAARAVSPVAPSADDEAAAARSVIDALRAARSALN